MAAVARFSALGLAYFFVVQGPIRSTAPPPGLLIKPKPDWSAVAVEAAR
jgi:hypothetical protein